MYTPPGEHFGIVPLEAMAAGRPVIACNQAGPLETVEHGVTGLLCRSDPAAFADAMQTILVSPTIFLPLGTLAVQSLEHPDRGHPQLAACSWLCRWLQSRKKQGKGFSPCKVQVQHRHWKGL